MENQRKLGVFQRQFPDLDTEICGEILGSVNYDLKLAIQSLGGDLSQLALEEEPEKDGPNDLFPALGPSGIPNLLQNHSNSSPNQPTSFAKAISAHTTNLPSFPSFNEPKKPEPESYNLRLIKENYNEVYSVLKNTSSKYLLLMRGVSGSGKSYLAQIFAAELGGVVISADDHFKTSNGSYVFDRNKLASAHTSAQRRALEMMSMGTGLLINDNTNTQTWEMLPYVKFALQFGYFIQILEPKNPWSKNPALLAKKNEHGVPFKKIKEQLGRFESISPEKLVQLAISELNKQGVKPAMSNYSGYLAHLALDSKKDAPETSSGLVSTSSTSLTSNTLNSSRMGAVFPNSSRTSPSPAEINPPDSPRSRGLPSTLELNSGNSFGRELEASGVEFPVRNDSKSEEVQSEVDLDAYGSGITREIQFGMGFRATRSEIESLNEFKSQEIPSKDEEDGEKGVIHQNSGQKHEKTADLTSKDALEASKTSEIKLESLEDVVSLLDSIPKQGPIPERTDTPEESFFNSVKNAKMRLGGPPGHFGSNTSLSLRGRDTPEAEFIETVLFGDDLTPELSSSPPQGRDLVENEIPRALSLSNGPSNIVYSSLALHKLFPDIEGILLDDIYKKCNGDLNWCAEILLEDGHIPTGSLDDSDLDQAAQNLPLEPPRSSNLSSGSPDDDDLEFSPYEMDQIEQLEELVAAATERSNLEDTELFETIDGDDWFDFDLEKSFVSKLFEIYSNPFDKLPLNQLPSSSYSIRIPPNLAFDLYQLFVLNHLHKGRSPTEASNGPGPSSSNGGGRGRVRKVLKPSLREIDERFRAEMSRMREATSDCPNLKKIIDIEANLSSLEAERVSALRAGIQRNLASKLALGKLQNAFPTLEIEKIEEMYGLNEGNFGRTLTALKSLFGSKFEASRLVENFPESQKLIADSMQEELNVIEENSPGGAQRQDKLENMSVQDLRALAFKHLTIRNEYQGKCQRAIHNGPSAAVFYSQMQKLHTGRMIEANSLAASKTLHLFNQSSEPNVIDLHCLYVREASEALLIFLQERIDWMHKFGMKKLSVRVITGRGKNSDKGIAKVLPEVIRILTVQQIQHTRLVGHVSVLLKSTTRIWSREELRRAGCNIQKDPMEFS